MIVVLILTTAKRKIVKKMRTAKTERIALMKPGHTSKYEEYEEDDEKDDEDMDDEDEYSDGEPSRKRKKN